MYKSPISIYETAMQTIMEQRENAILAKVQDAFGVQVDKEELIRALRYDRNQYEAGYKDGLADAKEELVRCKECKHFTEGMAIGMCKRIPNKPMPMPYDAFCSFGERVKEIELP